MIVIVQFCFLVRQAITFTGHALLHEDCNKSSISLLKLQTKICELIRPDSFEGRDEGVLLGECRVLNDGMDQLDKDNEGNSKSLKPQLLSDSAFVVSGISTHQPKICLVQMECELIDVERANRVQCSAGTIEELRYQGNHRTLNSWSRLIVWYNYCNNLLCVHKPCKSMLEASLRRTCSHWSSFSVYVHCRSDRLEVQHH